ncbi:MAG: S8 family serine peptidase [Candidatus Obscuribacterales bacterium]|nr:S8 family serine peptidase [Candidatus Obscuribacterales bacterium]
MAFRFTKVAASILAIGALTAQTAPANAFELQMPAKQPTPKRVRPLSYTPDLLIVVPQKNLQTDDLNEAMEEVHGTVVSSIGEGDLKCYVVKTEKGHMAETEKKLTKDKEHFSVVSRNYSVPSTVVPDTATNPQYPADQWHINALHCPEAWNTATGSGVTIAVLDSGCQASNRDLAGKCYRGFDAYGPIAKILGAAAQIGQVAGAFGKFVPGLGGIADAVNPLSSPGSVEAAGLIAGLADKLVGRGANQDTGASSHGTVVATTIAASMNNSFAGVGVAPNAQIYPIRIAENKNPIDPKHQYTTDLEIVAAMVHIMSKPNIRIVNIAYNCPIVGFHNAAIHPGIHFYFQKFFRERSGMIFMSAGNESTCDPTPPAVMPGFPIPYINLISGIDASYKLADKEGWGSNYGPAVTFTGPSVEIGCTDKNEGLQTQSGTSFSCPIVAAIAALILDKKPMATNIEVYNTLRRSCKQIKGVPGFNWYYGWGMPDAYAAVIGHNRPPATDGASSAPPSFNRVAGARREPATGRGSSGAAPVRTRP